MPKRSIGAASPTPTPCSSSCSPPSSPPPERRLRSSVAPAVVIAAGHPPVVVGRQAPGGVREHVVDLALLGGQVAVRVEALAISDLDGASSTAAEDPAAHADVLDTVGPV